MYSSTSIPGGSFLKGCDLYRPIGIWFLEVRSTCSGKPGRDVAQRDAGLRRKKGQDYQECLAAAALL